MPKSLHLSESGKYNSWLRTSLNFYYGICALRMFTLGWLGWMYVQFTTLQQRPAGLYSPELPLAKAIVPALPSYYVFVLVLLLAGFCNIYLLFYRHKVLSQLLLLLCLLWLNLPQGSYGYFSHVAHLFLLAHFLLLFAATTKPSKNQPDQYQYQCAQWFYAGLLFTYTLSGCWKILTLAYKLLTSSSDVHWLHPLAAAYNAVISFRMYDLPLKYADFYVSYPLFWQLSFLLVVYLQTIAVVAAFRPALLFWIAAALIIVHIINAVAFLIVFVVAPLVLLCLFFPYAAVISKYYKNQYQTFTSSLTGAGSKAVYKREYNNGDTDLAYNFEAYREYIKDRNYLLGGLLYFPGLRTLAKLYFMLSLSKQRS